MARAIRHPSLGELPGSPPRLARTLNRLTTPRSAPASVLRAHRWLYGHSGGRVGHGMIGAPTLLLRTTGRRTGRRRCSALCYARDGERFVVAASNEGADRLPAWFHNLAAYPEVELQVGRRRLSGCAAVIESSHPDYRRLWKAMNATNHGRYDWYQAQTSRPIALVAVTPTEQAAGSPRDSFAHHQGRLLEHYGVDAMSRSMEIMEPAMRVHLLEAGHGEPMIVLHGGDGEAVDWAPLLAAMQDRVHLYAVDRPGFGLSDPFDYRDVDLRRHAGDFVVSVLDALGLESATLVGGSLGGFFALATALDHPARVRAVVLVGYPAGLVNTAPLGQRVMAAVPPLARRVLQSAGADPDRVRAQYRRMFHLDPDTLPQVYFETRAAGMQIPGSLDTFAVLLHRLGRFRGYRREVYLGHDVARLSQPTLIIWGEHDMAPAAAGRAAAARMPHAEFVSLEGVGHFAFLQAPQHTAELITTFLDRTNADRSR